ncbi:MAG: hypothetical protein HZC54_01650 [Verrucomicrobia bacterium]|nr:hypothetical protein [Verrucomicrobiota bacterium]
MFTTPESPMGYSLPEEIVHCLYRIRHRESPDPREEALDPLPFSRETRRTPNSRSKRAAK